MKRFLYLFFCLGVLSCAENLREPATARGLSGVPLKEGALMTDEEFSLALNICQAYRTKTVNFKGEHLNKIFYLTLKEKSCTGESSQYSLGILFDGEHFVSPTSQAYIGGFQTHQQGFLARPCRYILQGERLRNPTHFSLDNGQKIEITFAPKSLGKHYWVRLGKAGEKIFYFQVNLDHSSPMVGTNTKSILLQACDAYPSMKYSELNQQLQQPN